MPHCSSTAFLNSCWVLFRVVVLQEWKRRWVWCTSRAQKCIHTQFLEKGFGCYFFGDTHPNSYLQLNPQKVTSVFRMIFLMGYFKNSFTSLGFCLFVCFKLKSLLIKWGEKPCPDKKKLPLLADLSRLSNFHCTQHRIMPSVVLLTIAWPHSSRRLYFNFLVKALLDNTYHHSKTRWEALQNSFNKSCAIPLYLHLRKSCLLVRSGWPFHSGLWSLFLPKWVLSTLLACHGNTAVIDGEMQ